MTTLKTTTYKAGDTLCVLAVTPDGPPFPISINLHGHPDDPGALEEGEFVLKHDIHGSLIDALLEAGLVEDTGKRCPYGYVTAARILRLTGKKVRDPLNDPPLLTSTEMEAYIRHLLARHPDEDPHLVRADAGMRVYEMEIGEWRPEDGDMALCSLIALAKAMAEPDLHPFWKQEAVKLRSSYDDPDNGFWAAEADTLLGRIAEAAPPPTYTSKAGTVYDLSLRHGMPYDSYGAVTAAAMDGDAEGLAKLLEICPREYRGRCDAMLTAAANGDLACLRLLLANHEGEEISALRLAVAVGHQEAVTLIRERMAALGKSDQLEEVSR